MGIFDAFTDALKSTVADQFIDAFTAEPFDEMTAVAPAISKNERPLDMERSPGVITNGSRIYVPENTVAIIMDQFGISEILTEPGGYEYWNGRQTVFIEDDIAGVIRNQMMDKLTTGGKLLDEKKVIFVNLREIRDIRFGTRGEQVYHDSYYDVDLAVRAFGNFTIRIVNPELFIRNYLPANTDSYSFADHKAKAQLVGELVQAFITALNSLSATYKVSELPSTAGVLSNKIIGDKIVSSWEDRFGIRLLNVSVQNIELSDDSKELIKQFASKRMDVKAYEDVSQKAASIAAQQKVSQGVMNHGLGDAGGIVIGMDIAQNLSGATEEKKKLSVDEQVEIIRKYKELLDEGILTEEEFHKKKIEILGL